MKKSMKNYLSTKTKNKLQGDVLKLIADEVIELDWPDV